MVLLLYKHPVMPWYAGRLPTLSQCCKRTVMLQQTNGPTHSTPCLTATTDGFFILKYKKGIFIACYYSKGAEGVEFCRLGQRAISLCYKRWSEKLKELSQSESLFIHRLKVHWDPQTKDDTRAQILIIRAFLDLNATTRNTFMHSYKCFSVFLLKLVELHANLLNAP